MLRGVGYFAGFAVLGSLAALSGCSGGHFMAEREPWRHDAEVACLNAGSVKEGEGKVRVKAINGPGMCGADFPIKVSSLGESTPIAFWDELRPPSGIPNAPNASMPQRWPGDGARSQVPPSIDEPPYDPRAITPPPGYPPPSRYPSAPVEARPLGAPKGGVPFDPGYGYEAPPTSLDPPAAAGPPPEMYDFRKPYGTTRPPATPVRRAPAIGEPLDANSPAYDLSPEPYDRRRVIGEPPSSRRADEPRPQRRYEQPLGRRREPVSEPPPALGPSRGVMAQAGPVSVSPAATLACPLVSVLDQWIAGAVQPAALKWLGSPVVEIKQISAYSCRGMNGNPNARISEHAFGNALDIASFTLADGRKITVKNGWHGTPEEQAFLRDVQGAACSEFTTVLAPGSNVYHYDHIHVDLMRRAGGRRACNPKAVSGEEIAARMRGRYVGRNGDGVTGSVSRDRRRQFAPNAYVEERRDGALPLAMPGADGED